MFGLGFFKKKMKKMKNPTVYSREPGFVFGFVLGSYQTTLCFRNTSLGKPSFTEKPQINFRTECF